MARRKTIGRDGTIRIHDWGYGLTTDGYLAREVELPPPPPLRPDAREVRSTFSDTHHRSHVRHGIVLPCLSDVRFAIEVFGGSREAPAIARTVDALDEARTDPDGTGISGGFLFAVTDGLRHTDPFVGRVLRHVDEAFAEGGKQCYHGSWDYDGPGPFHKASIDVERSGAGFVLHVHGAYTGLREERLATRLGLEARFVCAQHAISWATKGSRYEIPDVTFDRLQSCLDPAAAPGAVLNAFREHMRQLDGAGMFDDPLPFRWTTDAVEATVSLTNWRTVPHYELIEMRDEADEAGRRALELRFEGDATTGPARRHDRYDPVLHGAVGIEVRLRPVTQGDVAAVCRASDAFAAHYEGLPPAFDDSDR